MTDQGFILQDRRGQSGKNVGIPRTDPAPSGRAILNSEPNHKVDEWANEMVAHAKTVIAEAGPAFESLLRNLMTVFKRFKDAHQVHDLKDVRFEMVRWEKETGKLLLSFVLSPNHVQSSRIPTPMVDDFVAEVMARRVPIEFQTECALFLRSMVMQFALHRSTQPVDLQSLSFGRPEWVDDRLLTIPMILKKQPFRPMDVRRT